MLKRKLALASAIVMLGICGTAVATTGPQPVCTVRPVSKIVHDLLTYGSFRPLECFY